MSAPFTNHRVIADELLARIHPSLHAQIHEIDFERLTPEQVQGVFAADSETVLRDLIREMREKQLLS